MDLSELLNNSRLSSVCDHLVNGGDLDEYPERQSYAEEIDVYKRQVYEGYTYYGKGSHNRRAAVAHAGF